MNLVGTINLESSRYIGQCLNFRGQVIRLTGELGSLDCFPGGVGVMAFSYEVVDITSPISPFSHFKYPLTNCELKLVEEQLGCC